jgi:hypothetical protein
MTGRHLTIWLLLAFSFCRYTVSAAESTPVEQVDAALLEFLGELADDADEWNEYIEIAGAGMSPKLAEVDHAN